MPAIKVTKFLGLSPKVSPELTAESVAQEAVNVKLYSGDLVPYRQASFVTNVGRSGEVKTIYPLVDTSDGSYKWLSWATDVDVAVATSLNDEEQRIYFTGDGAPKVTNYELAVGATSAPWPSDSYDLGLPLPTTTVTAAEATFTASTTSSVARSSGNVATFVTSGAHGLRTGNLVDITGFTSISGTYSRSGTTSTVTITGHGLTSGDSVFLNYTSGGATDGTYVVTVTGANTFTVDDPVSGATGGNVELDMTSYNVSGGTVTVTNSTTFTVFSAGFAQSTYSISDGTVDLGGEVLPRYYLYTWYTPWGEESTGSEPSDPVYVKEGQTVNLSTLPTAAPAGDNFITGFRLYRTITSTSGSTYFLLKTIFFPIDLVSAGRTSNTVTVVTANHHNLAVGDKIKIDNTEFGGAPDTSFDVEDVTVDSIVSDTSFTYTAAGSDKAVTATTDGTLYWDTSELNSGDTRYYTGSTFTDDFDFGALSITLSDISRDAPDEDMTGLRVAQNNFLIGFVGNELCVSEPNKPWSWPIDYRLVFPHDIVTVEAVGGNIIVLTDKYPFIVYGSNPANLEYRRIDVIMPCLSKRGTVNMGYGVVYPTHGGLAAISSGGSPALITQPLHDWDTWDDIDPTEYKAEFFDGKWFGSHNNGSIIYERDEKTGGLLTTTPTKFYAAYYDSVTGNFYYIADLNGALYLWDDQTQPFLNMSWKSKVFVTNDYVNVGAARVVADYSVSADEIAAIEAYNATVPTTNAAWWSLMAQLGVINGPVDYTDPDTVMYVPVYGAFNSFELNGDPVTSYLLSTADAGALSFTIWANKEIITSVNVVDSDIFRLPTGYKSDTFEVAVSGKVRVRAIHFGESPFGLRTV
jgi:hypothetical protein